MSDFGATVVRAHPTEPEIRLLISADDEPTPEVTILIPAMNEERTIVDFVRWCKEGLARAGARGEILIIDSSSDATPQLAIAEGARVLRTPKRGLGRAYIDAIPFVRGRYVIMGDADCTYDFREIDQFVNRLREGYEFVMGSRWLGSIEAGAMPALHQYFGTPLTTWILNRIYGTHFTDIHCGMRALTRSALTRLGLSSQSWEYASEMVLKSATMQLATVEVPVTFYKDREGRLSHHKRSGWFSPFSAAWINLRAMFTYRVEFFVLKPGLAMLALGLLFTLPLSLGSVTVGAITFSLYWMLLGLTLAVLGQQAFFFGCLGQIFTDHSGRARERWSRVFRYTRAVVASAAIFVTGLGFVANAAIHYFAHGLTLPPPASATDHLAVTGLLFMITGFSAFGFTLLLHATQVRYGPLESDLRLLEAGLIDLTATPDRPDLLPPGGTSDAGGLPPTHEPSGS